MEGSSLQSEPSDFPGLGAWIRLHQETEANGQNAKTAQAKANQQAFSKLTAHILPRFQSRNRHRGGTSCTAPDAHNCPPLRFLPVPGPYAA